MSVLCRCGHNHECHSLREPFVCVRVVGSVCMCPGWWPHQVEAHEYDQKPVTPSLTPQPTGIDA